MRKKFLFILLAITMLGTIAYYYVMNFFLPVKFKEIINEQAQSTIHRRVSVGDIDFEFIKGFTIKDLKIFQKDLSDQEFFSFDEVNFNILLTSFFKNKQIVIPSIKITKPYLHLIRDNDGAWNFADLLELAKPQPEKAKGPTFMLFVAKVNLEDGKLEFSDRTQSEEFNEMIDNIDIATKLSVNKTAQIKLDATIPSQKTQLKFDGAYDISKKNLTGRIDLSTLDLSRYASFIPQELNLKISSVQLNSLAADITWQEQSASLKTDIAFSKVDTGFAAKNIIADSLSLKGFQLLWENNILSLSGEAISASAKFTIGQDKTIQGDLNLALASLVLNKTENNISADAKLTLNTANINLSPTQTIKGNIETENLNLISQNGQTTLQGDIFLKQSDITFTPAHAQGDLKLQNSKISFSGTNIDAVSDVQIDNAIIGINPDKKILGDIIAPAASLSLKDDRLNIKSKIQIKEADISLDKDKKFYGNPEVSLVLKLDLTGATPLDYSGSLILKDSLLTGLPYVNEAKNINGEILFKTTSLELENLRFTTSGMSAQLAGTIKDFNNPALNIHVISNNADLGTIAEFFPDLMKKFDLSVDGKAALDITFDGLASSPKNAEITGHIDLDQASLASPKLPGAFTDISGNITYKKDLVSWKNLNTTFQNRAYTLNGQIANFSLPLIDTTLASDNIELTTQIKLLNKAFQILALNGKLFNSTLEAKGDVRLSDDAEPYFDLRPQIVLNLKDLELIAEAFAPPLKEKLTSLDLRGVVNIGGLYRGRIKSWRNWELSLTAQAPRISINGFDIETPRFNIEQRDEHINKANLTAKLYEGDFNIISSADLSQKDAPLKAGIRLAGLSLAELSKNEKVKNKKLGGKLDLSMDIDGPALNLPLLAGVGTLSITEGTIFEWNILDGIFAALLINDFKQSSFTEAKADLAVRDKKLFIGNGLLMSKLVNLQAKGWIDFDQNINLDVSPVFSEGAIIVSDQLTKKFPTSILTQTDGYLQVKITGTLSNPKYVTETHPFKILKETTDLLKEGLGGILEEIF